MNMCNLLSVKERNNVLRNVQDKIHTALMCNLAVLEMGIRMSSTMEKESLESEVKKVKRFVKMLMTIQDKNDIYFVMEFTRKQSCEFQLQSHCEKGRVI